MCTLRQLFIGKNTLELARILADGFVVRFGERWGTQGEVLSCFLPHGRACTWGELDKHINVFCKRFYLKHEEYAEAIQFLDEVRFVIQDLPQRQEYTPLEDKADYPSPLESAYHFVLCSLCWRAVERRPLEKKTPLCHSHDLPSSHPEYRRRARLRGRVEMVRVRLVKALPNLWSVKWGALEQGEVGRGDQVDLDGYLQGLCLAPDSPLPYLSQYLRSLSRPPLDLPLATAKDVLNALEYHVYPKLPPRVREAWDCYLEDRSRHFRLNYVKLLTAEAWLETDAKHPHGGKRR
jgi:hypothetical protein